MGVEQIKGQEGSGLRISIRKERVPLFLEAGLESGFGVVKIADEGQEFTHGHSEIMRTTKLKNGYCAVSIPLSS